MYLPRAGREYLRITLANTPDDATVDVSFDDGATWEATTGTGSERRVLIAGPEATETDGDVVLLSDRTVPVVRITDTPEVVIRKGEPITLVD